MKKVILSTLIALIAVPAFAQTGYASAGTWALYLGAGLAIGLAGLGAGVGMGSAIRGGLEGISRNPGVASKIFTYLLVGVALIESIAIYGLVVSLILLFVK
ncbi:MAG: ATP synthase F0 subunit C [Mucispirillum sp.]|nr:ATP synthase F0 subunit C [Mucispirillum sp.]